MPNREISVQLYSVREEMQNDPAGTLAKLAEFGYRNVEPPGYSGMSAENFAQILQAAGLQAPSIHGNLPVGDEKNKVIEEAQALGTRYIFTGGPALGWDSWNNLDGIKKAADLYNRAAANASPHGLLIGFHNHDMEMADIEGEPAYRHFLRFTDPEVMWEIDTYWVQVGGLDPAAVVKEAGERAEVLHIKDGPGVKEKPMVAVGDGIMDIPAIIKAASQTKVMCIELDNCATNMLEALRKSYEYLSKIL